MFRESRKPEKTLSESEMREILTTAEYGVLSTVGEDGYPYGIPVNFVYDGENLYFHGAKEGHKVDNLRFSNKVAFTVVVDTQVLPKEFNTKFRSVIVFGKAMIATDEERSKVFELILEKYAQTNIENGHKYVAHSGHEADIYKIQIEHASAKGKK
ncbi:MAG: pyridoxamine 5'-phosphate oxidase family protein [Clostridiales bacterium]|nr:pyridoxamine 5'-phosphate oxidase family protein [Clostridiales bacterium]